MVKVSHIINKIEDFAPLSLQSEWDNSGWQVFLGDFDIDRVMLALSPTIDVINQAVEKDCKLVVAHHPMIFRKINKLSVNNFTNLPVLRAIQNNIQVYSAHTNLDVVKNGVADKLAQLLGLKNTRPIEMVNDDDGFGRVGELDHDVSLGDFLDRLKSTLNVDLLKVININHRQTIRTVAVCPGSGGDFIHNLKGVDLYITGDIKYHTALEVDDLVLVDAGHLETERIILPVLQSLLTELGIEIIIAKEKSPWQIV